MDWVLGTTGGLVRKGLGLPVSFGLHLLGADQVIEFASDAYSKAKTETLLNFFAAATKKTFDLLLGQIGPAKSAWTFIMGNPTNAETFVFARDRWHEIGLFLIDLMEPMKRFAPANSADGHTEDNEYNEFSELDLNQPMNRHAVVSQVQRLFKSIIELFKPRKGNVDISKLQMDTTLASDIDSGTLELNRKLGNDPKCPTWVFINGIAGEFFWTYCAVARLEARFFASHATYDIRGIFNRSDGMLWDLVECSSERRPGKDNDEKDVNETTISSKKALDDLSSQLYELLTTGEQEIWMIAHSQGCLILRLALYSLHRNDALREPMLKRLNVFTFGCPALDWEVHAFVKRTEHFANREDFVAKLGVLRYAEGTESKNLRITKGPYVCSECSKPAAERRNHPLQFVWSSEKKGHLFGSQYSLKAKDYSLIMHPHGKEGEQSILTSLPDYRNAGKPGNANVGTEPATDATSSSARHADKAAHSVTRGSW